MRFSERNPHPENRVAPTLGGSLLGHVGCGHAGGSGGRLTHERPGAPSVGPAQDGDRKGAPLRFACGDLFLGGHLGLLTSSWEQDHPRGEPLESHQ